MKKLISTQPLEQQDESDLSKLSNTKDLPDNNVKELNEKELSETSQTLSNIKDPIEKLSSEDLSETSQSQTTQSRSPHKNRLPLLGRIFYKRTPHQKYLLNVKLDKIKIIALQIAVLVGFFGLWELMTDRGIADSFITSSPSRIIKMFVTLLKQDIFKHIGITLLECILSFVISTVVGCIIAALLWWFRTARRVSEPFIVVINSLPKIALGPIIIVWMGIGMKAIVVMGILICIVVTIISVLNGFMSCDQGKILLLQSMGARKLQIFFKLVFPNSIPNLLSVLKINVGLAWVGTIMGEYLVSGAGLGYLIIYGGQVFKLDLVMTATVILCILAALMYLSVALIEKRINKHRV